jgi:hypothetical protein
MKRLALFLTAGFWAAAACGGGAAQPGPADGGPLPDGGPPPDGGFARRVGDEFYTVGQDLLSNGDGTGWLFWRSYSNPDFSHETIHLDRFEAGGGFVRSSELVARNPDGVVLHADGTLTAVVNRCGALSADTCFHHDGLSGPITSHIWPGTPRTITTHQLDDDGNLVGIGQRTIADARHLPGATAIPGGGLYALTRQGGYLVSRLGADYAQSWSVELLPYVMPPAVPIEAPIEDWLRAADLAHQLATEPVAVAGGVVVAATVARGTLAALSAALGLDLPLPADPRCGDVVVATIASDGTTARYFSVPTAACETLPRLTVVDNHAVVATVVPVAKPPEPNDTDQYDVGLAIVDLATGAFVSRTLALEENDLAFALAPCGAARVCVAGTTGARSVDTGSTVTFGDGFVWPVTLAGEAETPWILTSPRHTEIHHVVPRSGGLLFFAIVNGAITHTADGDPWLGFNEGLLGSIAGF